MSGETRTNRSYGSGFRLDFWLAAVALISCLFSFPMLAAAQRADNFGRVNDGGDQLDQYIRSYDRITLEPGEATAQVRDSGELRLVTQEGTFDLVLTPHDIRSPWYFAEEVSADGEVRSVEPGAVQSFKGSVRGIEEAQARFTITNDRVEGVILTPWEWYFVEPLRNYVEFSAPSDLVFYKKSDIVLESFGTCETRLAERMDKAGDLVAPRLEMAAAGSYVLSIATEADHEYVTAFGDSSSANNEILNILNQVEGVYDSEVGISFEVVYQNTWASSSDPYVSTAASTMLSEFRSHWNANFASLPYDVAHMWTGKNLDGSTIGIAWVDVVCSSRSLSYGVSQKYNPVPGKYILTAHELGHNFGASHSNQQTGCDNTIMNSSVGTGFNFCQYSRDQITSHANSNSACLDQGNGLAGPTSLSASAVASSQVDLGWQDNSADETGFEIERKTGAGGTWQQIATTSADVSAHSNLGLNGDTTYFYRVRAIRDSVSSPYSNEASATTSTAVPTITGLLPSSGSVGTPITITGTHFTGATVIKFNISPTTSFTILSPTQISATVPSGATTGKVSVVTPAGTAVSLPDFEVVPASGGDCDINNDGNLNVVDVQLLINVILSVTSCPGDCDVNNDGTTNVVDLQVLSNVILGLQSCP